jgi:hypothetical protein
MSLVEMWWWVQLALMETREVHAFVCVASVECLTLDQQDWKFDSDEDVGH